jgi:uncharacterized protein
MFDRHAAEPVYCRKVVPMWVDVSLFRRLPKGAAPIEDDQCCTIEPGDLPLQGRRAQVEESCQVHIHLQGGPRAVEVAVRCAWVMTTDCDRCLTTVRVPVDVQYAEVWVLDGPPQDEDDPSVVQIAVVGNRQALDDGFWQNVEMALPSKILCHPDCRGLCPHCGVDRNHTDCACATVSPDPRWASLQAMKKPEAKERVGRG